MLIKIHKSHLGVVKCKERARDVLYWPNMSTQIEEFVSQCSVCNTHKNSNSREPMISHPIPGRPWSKIGTDLFHFNGSNYLQSVDYYSKFPEISKLCTSRWLISLVLVTSDNKGLLLLLLLLTV